MKTQISGFIQKIKKVGQIESTFSCGDEQFIKPPVGQLPLFISPIRPL